MKEWNAEDYNKFAAEEFAKEYCKMVDELFIESLKDIHSAINIANLLQCCIDQTSESYGFRTSK